MRRYLLPKTGLDFKANLHCHTVVSDGALTPEEVKRLYAEQGYAVVAFTDHDVLIDQSHLSDEKFLALNGYELHVPADPVSGQTCHMNFIAKDPGNLEMVCHAPCYLWGNCAGYADQIKFSRDDYVRERTHAGISDMMRRGRDAGFFVIYNHPTWSQESYAEYSGYNGMHAMEIFNTGSWAGGYPEYNGRVYDDLLRQGKRIFCVAADDNHNTAGMLYPNGDSCGGWVVIRAESLTYENIMGALERGEFYASCGPEIFDLYVEDGVVYITTSNVREIRISTGRRRCDRVFDENADLTKAAFQLRDDDGYFRFDIIDGHGNHANTNAAFLDTL